MPAKESICANSNFTTSLVNVGLTPDQLVHGFHGPFLHHRFASGLTKLRSEAKKEAHSPPSACHPLSPRRLVGPSLQSLSIESVGWEEHWDNYRSLQEPFLVLQYPFPSLPTPRFPAAADQS